MKKMWIPVIIMIIAVVFMAGLYFGTDIEARRIQVTLERDHIFAEYIAVVNSDTGVIVDGERINYAVAIIETLGEGFELVSPAMAHNGMQEGIYRAVLTFPSNVSERILSFNTRYPERVVLDFQVNPNLAESDYIETHVEIINLQMAINLTMGYTYLSSVFSQFHLAQDEMGVVFGNKEATSDAIHVVRLEDFTPILELELMPEVEFEYVEADTSEYLLTVADFAEMVRDIYLTSFESAGMSHGVMQDMASSLLEDFPIQRDEWLDAVGDWTVMWLEYAADLLSHSESLEEYRLAIVDWHTYDGVQWHGELYNYGGDLWLWYRDLTKWSDDVYAWLSDMQGIIDGLSADLVIAIPALQSSLIAGYNELNIWHTALQAWYEQNSTGVTPTNVSPNLAERPHRRDFNDSCFDSVNCPFAMCDDQEACPIFNCSHIDPNNCECRCTACENTHTDACIREQDAQYRSAVTAWETGDARHLIDAVGANNATSQLTGAPPSFPFSNSWPITLTFPNEILEVQLSDPPEEPPEYGGQYIPSIPDLPDGFEDELVLPDEPSGMRPPSADELLADLDFMGDVMDDFDVGEFLTDELESHVQSLLDAYEDYLDIVRDDLAFQFLENILILSEVRLEYVDYLRELREAALEAEEEAREHLEETIYEFLRVADNTTLDTRERLTEFTEMMPYTRAAGGVNQDIVNFAIAPVDLVSPTARGNFDLEFTSNAGQFLMWLIYALALTGIVFIVLMTIHFVRKWRYHSRKLREK